MSGTRFIYNGNVIDYVEPEPTPSIRDMQPPPMTRAERMRRNMRAAAQEGFSVAEGIREFAPALAYGAGLLTGDPERAARWDESVRSVTRPTSEALGQLPGMTAEYSPIALATNAVPFSDELLGLAAAVDTGAPRSEMMRAADEMRHQASAAYPMSALAGGVAQGIGLAASPLPFLGRATGSTRAAQLANQLSPAASIGMGLGMLGGYLETPEDASVEQTIGNVATGGATGGALGAGAAGLGALGQGIRTAATSAGPVMAGLGRIAGAGVTGAGYGVASTPDATSTPIYEPSQMALDAMRGGGYGLGAGLALGTLGEGLSVAPRLARSGQRYLQEAFGDVRPQTGQHGSVGPLNVDEALAELGDLAPVRDGQLPGIDAPMRTLDEQLAAARSLQRQGPDLPFLLGLRQDPASARLQSIGISGPQAQARIGATFGGPRGFVEAAREFDLLPEHGVYDPTAMHTEFERLRDISGRQLRAYRQPIIESGATVSGDTIAARLEEAAARQEAITGPRALQRAAELRALANEYRFGRGFDPATAAADVPAPDPRQLSMSEILRDLEEWRGRNQRVWSTPGGPATPADEIGLDVYNAVREARDALTRGELTEQEFADYARSLRGYHVGVTGAPHGTPPRADAAQYGSLRGWLGAMTAASGPFGVAAAPAGFIGARLLSRYQPSMMATLNEGALRPTPETIQRVARSVIESASQGGAPVRIPQEAAITLANAADGNIGDIGRALSAIDEVIAASRQAAPGQAQALERAVQPLRQQQDWGVVMRTLANLARSNPGRWDGVIGAIESASTDIGRAAVLQHLVTSDPERTAELERAAQVEADSLMQLHDAYERRGLEEQAARLRSRVTGEPATQTEAEEPMSDVERQALEEQAQRLRSRLRGGPR